MKYLLIAVVLYASGGTSGLMPASWFDDEAACNARGENMRSELVGTRHGDDVAEAVHFHCIGLSPLDINIMGIALPYGTFIPSMP